MQNPHNMSIQIGAFVEISPEATSADNPGLSHQLTTSDASLNHSTDQADQPLQLDSFHPFPRLPKELREKIWGHAKTPNTVFIVIDWLKVFQWEAVGDDDDHEYYPTLNAHWKIPAILHTNQEARYVGLKRYTISFGNVFEGKAVYFDENIDRLCFRSAFEVNYFFKSLATAPSSEYVAALPQKLDRAPAVSKYLFNVSVARCWKNSDTDFSVDEEVLAWVLKRLLGRLRSLTLMSLNLPELEDHRKKLIKTVSSADGLNHKFTSPHGSQPVPVQPLTNIVSPAQLAATVAIIQDHSSLSWDEFWQTMVCVFESPGRTNNSFQVLTESQEINETQVQNADQPVVDFSMNRFWSKRFSLN